MNGLMGCQGHYGKKMKKQREEERWLHETFERSDSDHSGGLDKGQLAMFLHEVTTKRYEARGEFPPKQPSGDDMQFLIATCDHTHDGTIHEADLKSAVSCWNTYLESYEHVKETFDKYDENRSGRLERPQLRAYLLDILAKEGEYGIEEEDIDYVLSIADKTQTGSVLPMELNAATAAFMTKRAKAQDSFCSVM